MRLLMTTCGDSHMQKSSHEDAGGSEQEWAKKWSKWLRILSHILRLLSDLAMKYRTKKESQKVTQI